MASYSMHLPPGGAARRLEDVDRLVFVREGFSWLAFLFPVLWLLWHRMWLPLLGYLLVVLLFRFGGDAFGVSEMGMTLAALMAQLLFGFEANALRRWSLVRKGWSMQAVVEGRNHLAAEVRALGLWLEGASFEAASDAPDGEPPSRTPPRAPMAARAEPSYVIGSFAHAEPRR
jgi:hypothetical protein